MMILIVIAVIVYLAVDIAYRIIELTSPASEPVPHAAAVEPAVEMAKAPLEAYAVVVEKNLFRTTDQPIVVDETDPNTLEATTLKVDLYGTIAGEDGMGYAVIEDREKKTQRLYKVGDKVAGATIVKVVRNAIVLRSGERDQVLKKKEGILQRIDSRPVEAASERPGTTRRPMDVLPEAPTPSPTPALPPAPSPTPGRDLPMPIPVPIPGIEAPKA